MLKKKIMFDCNIFDEVLDDNMLVLLENNLDKYEYFIIQIQEDELHNIPDYKKEKREKLLDLIVRLDMKKVYISPAIYGTCKYGQAKYGGDRSVYDKILFHTKSNTDDSLIASSAIREGCIVITNDIRFYEKMKFNDYPVMNFKEFMTDVRSNAQEWKK